MAMDRPRSGADLLDGVVLARITVIPGHTINTTSYEKFV
jgi:hypothetical protein